MSARRTIANLRAAQAENPWIPMDDPTMVPEALCDIADATTEAAEIRERGADGRADRAASDAASAVPHIKVQRSGAWLREQLKLREEEFAAQVEPYKHRPHHDSYSRRIAISMLNDGVSKRRAPYLAYIRHFRDVVAAVPPGDIVSLTVRESAWFTRPPWAR